MSSDETAGFCHATDDNHADESYSKKRGARKSDQGNKHDKKEEDVAGKGTFVDAAAMKEKVRQNLSKPQYIVSDFYKDFGICQIIARSTKFEKMTLAAIGLNAVWIMIDTDYNKQQLLLDSDPVFIFAENAFCAFFSFEWFVRFMSFRRKRDGLKDMWFVFDSLLVLIMVIETWFFTMYTFFLQSSGSTQGGGGGGSTGVIKVARLFRLSRMARMARLLRAMPELMIMIKGMMAATRSVFFTLCLLFTIMYVFGIAFTQMAAEFPMGKTYFSGVPRSMFTLLLYGTFLDNVGPFAVELLDTPFYLSLMFFIFVLVGSLTVMNMLVGVLCEVVSAVAATEQEEMLVTYVNDKLSKVMALLDTDGGGTISKKEFVEILDNADAVRCLNDVGVDVFGLVDLADYIFEDDDSTNEDEVELDFSKFMEVVLQLRGTNQATVKDIVDLRKFMRLAMQENYRQSQAILDQLQQAFFRSDKQTSTGDAVQPPQHGKLGYESAYIKGVIRGTSPYEVEGGSSPRLPQATSDGQLLKTFNMDYGGGPPTVSAVGGHAGEGLVLKGDWCPCEAEIPSRGWRMPGEDEIPRWDSGDAGAVEVGEGDATAIDVTLLLAGPERGGAPSCATVPEGIDGHPLVGTWETSASVPPRVGQFVAEAARGAEEGLLQVDMDMEAVRDHVDKLCKHLQTGLDELLHHFQLMYQVKDVKNANLRTASPPKYESGNLAFCKL